MLIRQRLAYPFVLWLALTLAISVSLLIGRIQDNPQLALTYWTPEGTYNIGLMDASVGVEFTLVSSQNPL